MTSGSHYENLVLAGAAQLRIVGTANLSRFDGDKGAMKSLNAWREICDRLVWKQFLDVRRQWPDADSVGDCVVFNVRHNRYRLITKISYGLGLITVVSVLTHAEYDRGGWRNVCGC